MLCVCVGGGGMTVWSAAQGADASWTDAAGHTPLHWAAAVTPHRLPGPSPRPRPSESSQGVRAGMGVGGHGRPRTDDCLGGPPATCLWPGPSKRPRVGAAGSNGSAIWRLCITALRSHVKRLAMLCSQAASGRSRRAASAAATRTRRALSRSCARQRARRSSPAPASARAERAITLEPAFA